MVDGINKEVCKLNAVADMVLSKGADGINADGLSWLISDSADEIKKLANTYHQKRKRNK